MNEKIIITKANELWKVEMYDKYGFKSTVYEKTINDASKYAEMWLNSVELRKNSYDSIGNMIEIDKKAGRNFPLD